jgi:hypothetical protein
MEWINTPVKGAGHDKDNPYPSPFLSLALPNSICFFILSAFKSVVETVWASSL